MSKKKFTCINCLNEYYSDKENSKWCSKQCQNEYNRVSYNCDYCNAPMILTRSKAEKLKNGERKNAYCSKECQNRAQNKTKEKNCENCGKPFQISQSIFENTRFCCKKCYEEFRQKNALKNKKKICPICKKIFFSENDNTYCSRKCAGLSQQNRNQCRCEYCGELFNRKKSDIQNANHHYCSNECRILSMQWNEHDKDILRENYHKLKTREISKLLSKDYSVKNINAEAIRLGITIQRNWSIEEEELLKKLYSSIPLYAIMKIFSNRTLPSILGKARVMGLLSYDYLQSRYSDSENEFLKDKYLLYSNEELSNILNRTSSGIAQHLYSLGLYRPLDLKSSCYKNISQYVRSQIKSWVNKVRAERNYTCCITGSRSNIVVHHCRSFNVLLQEAINAIDFQIIDDFNNYNINDLNVLVEKFLEIQDFYGEYVCINKNIHELFHKQYGYGYNTIEQWNEFVSNYNQFTQ